VDDRTDPPHGISVGPTASKGRGVFATRPIRRAEVVESAPVIVIPADEQKRVHATLLNDYVFGWGDSIAVALGYGSLYNHAWEPNLEYRKRLDDGLIDFVALRDIAEGEELTTNYSSSSPESAFLWADLS
jgi:SET domain-containing protein